MTDHLTAPEPIRLAEDIEQAKLLLFLCERDGGDTEAAAWVLTRFVARARVSDEPLTGPCCPCGLPLCAEAGSLWRCSYYGHPWLRAGDGRWLPAKEIPWLVN